MFLTFFLLVRKLSARLQRSMQIRRELVFLSELCFPMTLSLQMMRLMMLSRRQQRTQLNKDLSSLAEQFDLSGGERSPLFVYFCNACRSCSNMAEKNR